MCFSAEASFVAAAALGGSGAVLTNKFAGTKKVWLAATALLFGVQQAAEGVLWLAIRSGEYPNIWGLGAQYLFLFFAYMLWPVWMPMAFMAAEKQLWRKRVMGLCLIPGVAFFLVFGLHMIFDELSLAQIINCSISYGESPLGYRLVYAAGGLIPFFVSSIPRMWILGLLIGVAFGVADYLYFYAFTSVWCFFAAVIVIGFFFLLKREDNGQA